MTDREKVERGLERCAGTDCTGCPYQGISPCQNKLAEDALALLKEQEPRVLSWEEVKKSWSAYRYVELYSPQVQRLALIYCIVRQSETIPEFYNLLEDSGVRWCRTEAEYNRGEWWGAFSGWRCWTSRCDVLFDTLELLKAEPVRCADCRYYEKRCPSEDIGWCNRPGAGCGQPEEFWCAGAERKEGDDAETD